MRVVPAIEGPHARKTVTAPEVIMSAGDLRVTAAEPQKETVHPKIDAWLRYLASRNVRPGFQPYYAAPLDEDRVLDGLTDGLLEVQGCIGGKIRLTFSRAETRDILQTRSAGPYVRLLHVGLVYGLAMDIEPQRVVQRTKGDAVQLDLPAGYRLIFSRQAEDYRLAKIECLLPLGKQPYPPDHVTLPSEFDRVQRWIRHLRGATGKFWTVGMPAGPIDHDLVASIVSPRGITVDDVNSSNRNQRFSFDAIRRALRQGSGETHSRFLHVGFRLGDHLESSALAASVSYDVTPVGLVIEALGEYRLTFEGQGENARLTRIDYLTRTGH